MTREAVRLGASAAAAAALAALVRRPEYGHSTSDPLVNTMARPSVFVIVCSLLSLSIAPGSATHSYGIDPNAVFTLTTDAAGASAAHAISFEVSVGEPEIYRAIITYGEGFRVRSFQTQGAIGSPVGSYELDVDSDGVADRVMPVRSVAATTAYIDVIPDNVFTPDLEPMLTIIGGALEMRMPFGGDANRDTRVSPFAARVTLTLFPQIIFNPPLGGDYPIVVRLTTVDPDSDGPDDGVGTPPDTQRAAFTVHINGPVLVPFARLTVEHFDLKPHGSHRDRFTVRGRYALGAGSDGIDWRRDSVTISFASFSQTIPLTAFTGNGPMRQYHGGAGPGVDRFTLRTDGRFDVDVRELHLIIPERWQTFSLRIGNDFGADVITLPSKRSHDDKNENDKRHR